MSDGNFKQYDFDQPSVLFILEDKLKALLGGPLLYNSFFKTFGSKGNERVLDFDCGGGTGSRCLAKLLDKGGHLNCIEASRYWIARAERRLDKYTHVECRSGDIRKLDIPDFQFDVISTFYVIHEIPPAERQDIAEALCRKLRTGGFFFTREPAKESHGMPPEEIRALLSDAGLNEIEHKETKSAYMGKYQKPDGAAKACTVT